MSFLKRKCQKIINVGLASGCQIGRNLKAQGKYQWQINRKNIPENFSIVDWSEKIARSML